MTEPRSRDFASISPTPTTQTNSGTRSRRTTISSSTEHPRTAPFDLEANVPVRRHMTMLSPGQRLRRTPSAIHSSPSSDEDFPHRFQRANTVVNYHTDSRTDWEHGAEPGIDTRRDTNPQYDHLVGDCQITVVDFSEQKVEKYELDNAQMINFMSKPKDEWVKCRWINVNGLSWDVIKCLGNKYKLHRLAVEDLLNTRGRAKVDWYPDNVYILLKLQKLIRLPNRDAERKNHNRRWWQRGGHVPEAETVSPDIEITHPGNGITKEALSGPAIARPSIADGMTSRVPGVGYRTIQRSRGDATIDRDLYMERNSPLTNKGLAVSIEQVSIFLVEDNTVIAFFEHSADDIEEPIIKRLSSPDTILRKSCDSSMVFQAIIDAMTDLFFAVSSAYEEIIGELELDVLQDPSLQHSRLLYIIQSELTLLRNNMQPIAALIAALRDHRRGPMGATPSGAITPAEFDTRNTPGFPGFSKPSTGIVISAMARTYFADVEDHTLQMMQTLDTMRTSTSNMIDLIFNQMGALQNETMAVLTAVTIFFLPLTFLTGYFGQNFEVFPAIKDHSDEFFWIIAVPVMAVTMFILSFPRLKRLSTRLLQKMWIRKERQSRTTALMARFPRPSRK